MASDREPKPLDAKRRPPAKTPEAREAQMVALAFDFAEQEFRAGRASSQVTTHFLKLGSMREQKEIAKLEADTRLAEAKIKATESAEEMKVIFEEAMTALTGYKRGPEL